MMHHIYLRKKTFCFLCILASISIFESTAQVLKEKQNNTQNETYELFDVSLEDLLNVGLVSASKKKQSVNDAPATAHVVTEEQIKMRGYISLDELLEDIPEIEIQRNSNPEFRNIAGFRGITGNEKFLILLNGVRITPATGDGYTLGQQYYIGNAQRVEVILGPASALYGVDAFSGIVNIITKSQETKDYKEKKISALGGMYQTLSPAFSFAEKMGKLSVSAQGNYLYSAEPNYAQFYPKQYQWYTQELNPNGNILESPFYQKINTLSSFENSAGNSFGGPSLSRGFGMPTQSYFFQGDLQYSNFTLGYLRNEERHHPAWGVHPAFTTFDPSTFIQQKQEVVYGKHTYTSFNKKWGLQSHFSQSLNETNPNSHFANAASRWQRGYIYHYALSARIEEQFNYDFSSKLSLIAGGLYENLASLPRTGLSPIPFDRSQPGVLQDIYFIGAAGFKPIALGQTPTFNDSLTLKQNFYNIQYQNYGGYAQWQYIPVKSIEITVGSRYDYNTRFGGSFNPRAGIVFLPNHKLRIKCLYGEAFLAPSPRKAYEQAGGFYSFDANTGQLVADFFRIANPSLKPEKLRSLELNTSYLLHKSVSLAGNAYYTQIDNLIDLFGVAPVELEPKNIRASRLETSVNQGNSTVYGGTGKINVLQKIGSFQLNVSIAYSYTNGNINQKSLPFTAQHSVKSVWELSHKKWGFSIRTIYRSASKSNQTEMVSMVPYSNDAFLVLHANAYYDLMQTSKAKITIQLKGNNLMNQKYYHVFVGNDEGLGYTPQDPTRLMASIGIQF
jgi:outer membrane cobalamin receptor